jgi:hypothetical protein
MVEAARFASAAAVPAAQCALVEADEAGDVGLGATQPIGLRDSVYQLLGELKRRAAVAAAAWSSYR